MQKFPHVKHHFSNGISDLCLIAIVYFVIIHYKSCELILTEDFLKKVTIRCEIIVDLALMQSDAI